MGSLVIAEQARGDCGGKAFRAYLVTCDGSNATVDASDLGLHYIDSAQVAGVSMSGDIGPYLCTGAGTSIVLGNVFKSGDTINLWVWGY